MAHLSGKKCSDQIFVMEEGTWVVVRLLQRKRSCLLDQNFVMGEGTEEVVHLIWEDKSLVDPFFVKGEGIEVIHLFQGEKSLGLVVNYQFFVMGEVTEVVFPFQLWHQFLVGWANF